MMATPKIRFKGFSGDWEQKKLGEICDPLEYGLNAAAVDFDGVNKYIRITDIDEDTRQFKQDGITSPDMDLTGFESYKLVEGDILLARTGASVGKTYRYHKSDGLVYYAGFLIRARTKLNFASEFVFQNTFTRKYDDFISVMSQRSGQPGVNAQEYSNFEIFAPNKSEQTATGNFFRTLDDTITLHKRKLDGLKELKKGYLQQMFPQAGESVPRVRFAGFSGDWEQRKFNEIVNRVSIQSYADNLPKVEFEDIVSGEGMLNKDISKKFDKRKGIAFEPGHILYGKLRPYLKNWLFPDFKGVALGDFWVFEAVDSVPAFCYYLIQSDKYQEVANLSTGTKMPRSDWKIVSDTDFHVPIENSEQAAIGNLLRDLDEQIVEQQSKLDKLKQLKAAYLQRMFV